MDDDRTQGTLDNLADLFLTGTSSSPRPAAKEPRDHLDGPRPVRLPPKTARQDDREPPADEDVDGIHVDAAMPSLRLHRDDEPVDEQVETAEDVINLSSLAVTVEAVFVGNLPGFGSPWLTQYADHVAETRGPVLLIHADHENIDVELVGPGHGEVLRDATMQTVADRSAMPLNDVVGRIMATGTPKHVIVHLSEGDPQVALRAAAFDQWSMICGADEAAVVSIYRLLKQLMDAGAAGHQPHVGLMVLGSDSDASSQAAVKLNAACDSFLQMPIELLGHRKQMKPVNVRVVGSYDSDDATWSEFIELLDQVVAPVDAPAEHEQAHEMVDDADTVEDAERQAPDMPSIEQPVAGTTEAVEAEVDASESKSRPAPAQIASDTPSLSTYVTGSLAIEARCPKHPATQIVIDQDGALHLLRQHDHAATLKDALVDLIETRVWVREHAELLQLTQRQCRFDLSVEPALHLFTDDAKPAVQLAAQMGEDLRLHLLQRVAVGDASTWVATELN